MASTEHDQRDVEAAKAAISDTLGEDTEPQFDRLWERAVVKAARIGRLMAEGKWPEVDPDLIAARECAASLYPEWPDEALRYRNGSLDESAGVMSAVVAIKRIRASLDGGRS